MDPKKVFAVIKGFGGGDLAAYVEEVRRQHPGGGSEIVDLADKVWIKT